MWALAFGARTGVRMTLMFSLARRVSKARGNLASRSWITTRRYEPRHWVSRTKIATALPGSARLGRICRGSGRRCVTLDRFGSVAVRENPGADHDHADQEDEEGEEREPGDSAQSGDK